MYHWLKAPPLRHSRDGARTRAGSPIPSRFDFYLLPVLITLLGLGLYLYGLDSKSLWHDELGTLACSGWRSGWWAAVRDPLAVPTTPKPPLSFLITHLFLSLGDRVFFLRFQAALFATLTIPIVYALAAMLFPGPPPKLDRGRGVAADLRPGPRPVGLLAAFLLAISPLYLRYAQEARMYALWTCLSMLGLYFFLRALRSTTGRWWLLFVLVAVLALYSHLFAVLPLGVMALFALWLLFRPASRAEFPFRAWHFIAAFAAILVFFAPLVPFVAQGLASGEGLVGEPAPSWDPAQLLGALRLFSGGAAGLVLYGGLLLLGAAALAMDRRQGLLLAVLWILLPVAAVVLTPFSHAVRVRYFLFALPVYLLLVAYGLAVALQWLAHRAAVQPAARRPALAVPGLLLLLAGLAAINAPQIVRYHAETKQRWQDAMSLLNARAQPGDQVFVRHIYHQLGLLFYASQLPPGKNGWDPQNVQIFPRDLSQAFPPGDSRGKWLVGPFKERFLPGGEFETWLRPEYSLDVPVILPASGVPQEAKLLAPTSYRTLVIVRAVPFELPLVRFWSDVSSLPAGSCTWLHWAVEGVREVYLDGEGVVGYGQREVCPTATRQYQLSAIQLDGGPSLRQIEIAVRAP